MHPASLSEDDLLEEVRLERTRATGPGGQHRNRVATAVRATHLPTGISTQAYERRSQLENKKMALRRLRLKLALDHRSTHADADYVAPGLHRPTELWRSRAHGERLSVSTQHRDFPALLAEALDTLDLYEDDVGKTAAALRVSRSQLIKFLNQEPAALAGLNSRRKGRGLRPLR